MKRKELAEILDLSTTRVGQLVKAGIIPTTNVFFGEDFDLLPAVHGYIKYLRGQLATFSGGANYGLGGELKESPEIHTALVPGDKPQFGIIPLAPSHGKDGELVMSIESWDAFFEWIDTLQAQKGAKTVAVKAAKKIMRCKNDELS